MRGSRSLGNQGVWKRGVSLAVAVSLVLAPWQGALRAESAGTAVGTLAVASDPAGAAVYVDGRLSGTTPVTVSGLAAGDHRVRLVKAGHLENGRIVRVVAGETKPLDITLTRYQGTSTPAAGSPANAGGGHTLLWVGLGIVGAAVAYFIVAKKGEPPVAGIVSPLPGTVLAGTNTVISAKGANDPGNKTLTYLWDFGDGTPTSTLEMPSHAYASAGVYTITVTVSNGSKTATATGTVTVRSLTGTFAGTLGSSGNVLTTTVTLVQAGVGLSGSFTDLVGDVSAISGSVSTSAPHVTFTLTDLGATFTGEVNATVNTITGFLNGPGISNLPWTMTRQ